MSRKSSVTEKRGGGRLIQKPHRKRRKPSEAKVDYVSCSCCGKRVSNFVTVLGDKSAGLVVRAWVECPECITEWG